MKRLLLISVFIVYVTSVRADHITGGEMYYTLTGNANGQFQYSVTMKLLMRCNSGRQFNNPSVIAIFSNATNSRVSDINVPLSRRETLQLTNPSRCITNPPNVCYEVGYYEFSISLPPSVEGYTITGQVVFRVAGMSNLVSNYGSIGATYTAQIPGTAQVSNGAQNSSARFAGSDLVVVCAGNSFVYSFAANDSDGDRLRYSFCDALQGGSGGGNNSAPPAAPPYQAVPYSSSYSGTSPLGSKVSIDPNTGLITGVAPAEAGVYVVTVCVEEIRNGTVIATQRKDIQINIAPCTVAGAVLQPEYMLCKNSKTISLVNLSTSSLISTQYWEITSTAGASLFTSTSATVSYTFADTGTYRIKLVINRGQECTDSTTALTRVYPGFIPDFSVSGACFTKPTLFADRSVAAYGRVNHWNWDLGENSTGTAASQQNPQVTYASTGTKSIRLIAGTTTGCMDTVSKIISITDKAPLALAFRDTLICVPDDVQLQAAGNGAFSWTPTVKIINANTASPTVSPAQTTTYYVDVNDNGCLNRDSVTIRVTDHVTLTAMNDTTVCRGDSIQLHIASDAFRYTWTPAAQVSDAGARNPRASGRATTIYRVTAAIGSCTATDDIVVNAVPYPLADAGADTTICFSTAVQLHGATDGNALAWSPAGLFSNAAVGNPVVRPPATTSFILSAYDNKGCPKAGRDTVTVTVFPKIMASAGRDTTVITGQPLQLAASGGVTYAWSPATALSATGISNPVALFTGSAESIRYRVLVYDAAHCVDSAFLRVKVFNTLPAVFVPNAFTPDGNGHNDVLKPITAGIRQIAYFSVYNRWGQLVFTTAESSRGWNGTLAGKLQDAGIFVWMVKATDYNGKPYIQKGTVMLIR